MSELRNIQADLSRFRNRVLIAALLVVVAFLLLGARLVYLQVFRHDDLREQADNNRITAVPVVPNRGLILDRNGVVVATNYSAYTLEITPSKINNLDQVIDDLSRLIEILPRDKKRLKKLLEESKGLESLPLRTRLTDEEVAKFSAQRFRFPGVDVKARLYRNYPFGETASHVIGYIGRINQADKERLEESEDESNYRGTDYMGKLGVEQSFEKKLHGLTGVEDLETSAGGHAVRKLASSPASALPRSPACATTSSSPVLTMTSRSMMPLGLMIAARSRRFASSRTLPGQSCFINIRMALSLISRGRPPC
mgnify:CR=1 FL=1